MTAGAKPYTMKVVRTVFNGGHEETYGNATRLVPTQQGYCWRTQKCRTLSVPYTFFEGKKAGETFLRKGTPRTLKGVRQQYREGLRDSSIIQLFISLSGLSHFYERFLMVPLEGRILCFKNL